MVSQLIVKPRARADAKSAGALQAFDAGGLSKTADFPMKVLRTMSGEAYVISWISPSRCPRRGSSRAYDAQRQQRGIRGTGSHHVPDRNDALRSWLPSLPMALFAPAATNLGGADLPDAWMLPRAALPLLLR